MGSAGLGLALAEGLASAGITQVVVCPGSRSTPVALALARLAGVSGLAPSVDWLLYSAIRKEALLTSQIEGTQASLADLFDPAGRPWPAGLIP